MKVNQHKGSWWRRAVAALSVGFAMSSAVAANKTVTFKDDDGRTIWSESIKEGECAFPPCDPVKFGYDFAGWSDGSQVKSYEEIDQLPVTAAKTWTATYTPHEGARRLRVGIYSGPGANGTAALNYHRYFWNNPRVEYKHVHSDRVRTDATSPLEPLDMFLIPGGTTQRMYDSLDTAGRNRIKNFVQQLGGRYFGTCAGTAFQMNDTSGSHMGLAPYKLTAQDYHSEVYVALTEKGQQIFGGLDWDGSITNRIYYSGSPIMSDAKGGFVTGTYHFDVLATYTKKLNSNFLGQYAMVCGTNYLGRLFLTGPHPEVYQESHKFITTGIRWLFDEGVARNGATAEELKAASTGLTFALPTSGKDARAIKVAYGPAAFTTNGAEELLELVNAIDQHNDYVMKPMSADNIKAGNLDGYDALVVPKNQGDYSSDAITAFKSAGGKVFYESSVGATGVLRGLREVYAAQPVPMEDHEDWGWRYPLLGANKDEEAVAFTKTGEDMTWTVPAGVSSVECLVVGGGGGGGRNYGGGGGAGGLIHRENLTVEPGQVLTIRVGAGGAGGVSGAAAGENGESTSVSGTGVNLVAAGGGGGNTAQKSGLDGASGGGSGGQGNSGTTDKGVVYAGGAGTDGQGFAGGSVTDFSGTGGAGGGGAGGAGTGCNASGVYAGRAGGTGVTLDITGQVVGYAGGGGGGGGYASTAPAGGSATCGGGAGGAGVKGATTGGTGKDGKAGTGGGGGGGGRTANGGAGGSGVVIFRYALDPNAHHHLYGAPAVVVAPSCTNDGYEVSVCTNSCPDVPAAARTNVLFATGHDWSEWVVVVEPTEEAEGLRHRTCGNCDTVEEEEIHLDDPSGGDEDDPFPDVEYVGQGEEGAFPVTFTFDDCFKSHRETVAPLFKKYGWPATFNICLNHVADSGKAGTNQMSWAEIREIRDLSGDFAFAAHSITHGHLENMSAAKYTEEIETSRDRIITELGVTPTYFCHPYTASSPAEERAIRAAGMKPMSLNRHAMPDGSTAPGQYYSVKNIIEREMGKSDKMPMDILFHGIDPKWGGTNAMKHEGDFEGMMAEVAELVKSGTIRIVTYDEFYAKIPPSLGQKEAEPVDRTVDGKTVTTVVPTHRPQLKAFAAKSAADRAAAMTDATTRTALADEGDCPRPAAFTWFGDGEIAFTLKQGSKTVFTTNLVGNALEVGNLEVNQTYTWTVANANGSASGTFKTEDESPRLVKDETTGVALREFGGAMGMDAKRIRRQLVFRATGADFGDGLVGAVNKVAVPDDFPTYAEIFTDAGKAKVKTLLETVMNPANLPLAFHSANDDRTGTLAFILGALLGADEDLLTLDWQLLALRNDSTSVTMDTLDPLVSGFAAYGGETLNDRVAAYVESAGVPFSTVVAFRNAMLEDGWAAPMVGPVPVATDYAVQPLVNAGWGYQIVGIGDNHDEVALVFTNATGALKWSVPTGVTRVRYCLVGGGGAGGSISSDSGYGGYGGNGGEVVESEIELTSPEMSVLIGIGGVKSASNYSSGGAGQKTTLTVNGTTVLSAAGGAGGLGGKVNKHAGNGGAGAGGPGAEYSNSKGGAGGPGVALTIIDDERLYGAGGGGGASGTGSSAGGAGGTTGGGAGGKGNSDTSSGGKGTFYGAGGGGSGGPGYTKGGNGYQGVVIVRYGCEEIPEEPAENSWTTQPSIEPTSFEAGTVPTLNVGVTAYGTPKANYTAEQIAALAAGDYTFRAWVDTTVYYTGLTNEIPFVVTPKSTPPSPPGPPDPPVTDDVTTNAMADASWGYTITGLGDNHRDVALVFTNTAATMDWTVPDGVTSFEFLVVGGGGAGGTTTSTSAGQYAGGGGGGGGMATGRVDSVSYGTSFGIEVGKGGHYKGYDTSVTSDQDGSDSRIYASNVDYVVAKGGGHGGGVYSGTTLRVGGSGGSAGAAASKGVNTATAVTTATSADGYDSSLNWLNAACGVSGQVLGHDAGGTGAQAYGSGGGGAGAVGSVGTTTIKKINSRKYGSGEGGIGAISTITGAAVYYAGGGGGGSSANGSATTAEDLTWGALGGLGGGGQGGDGGKNNDYSISGRSGNGRSGKRNTGGGGGGEGYWYTGHGGNGGSGVVIIRYTAPQGDEPQPEAKPKVDGKEVEPDAVFETATSAKPIVYPEGTLVKVSGAVGEQTIEFGGKTVDVPRHYTVEANGQTVSLVLNDFARPVWFDGEGGEKAIAVGETKVSLHVEPSIDGLYYRVVSATGLGGDWMPVGSGEFTQEVDFEVERNPQDPAAFYKVEVSDYPH